MDSSRRFVNIWSRKLHRIGSLAIFVPLALVIGTGLLLQLRKELDWIQPPTQVGASEAPGLSFEAILEAAGSVPEAGIDTWEDVDRIDVRPGKGVAKVRAESRWGVQVDTQTGEVLQAAYRRSDLIESLHDGSFFGDWARLGVFLPAAAVLLGLWLTGAYLLVLPHLARRKRRQKLAARHRPPLG